MKNNTVDLATFVENIYKNYSLYVLESRAIPDVFGLKRSQIKCLWTADKYCRKFMKTYAFTGAVALHAGYHHADTAMHELISKFAQDFPGSNNFPLLEGRGAFGSQTVPDGVAAPRYTEVRLHKNFDILFPKIDFNVLPPSNDPENPEPAFLAPLIPITLVNGGQGIAVAYASKIYPRSIKHLVETIENILDGKEIKNKNIPYFFKGYTGPVIEENGKYVLCGVIKKIKPNVLEITEVPFKYTLETYREFLFDLREKGTIENIITDNSSDKFDIIIKVPDEIYSLSEEQLLDVFGLKMNINENITIIGIDKTVKVFDNVVDYLKYFVDIRLKIYQQRKNYLLNENLDNIITAMIKYFIVGVFEKIKKPTKDLIFQGVEKEYKSLCSFFNTHLGEQIVLSQNDFNKRISEILSTIRLLDITSDRADEYALLVDLLVEQRKSLIETDVLTMYKKDLHKLLQNLK